MESLEITDVLIGYENMQDTAKSTAHYQHVYDVRTNRDTALANSMNEAQLAPVESEQTKQLKQQKIDLQKAIKRDKIKTRQLKLAQKISPGSTLSLDQLPEPELSPMDDVLDEDVQKGNFDLGPVLADADKKIQKAIDDATEKLGDLESLAATPPVANVRKLTPAQAVESFSHALPTDSMQAQSLSAAQLAIQPTDQLELIDDVALVLREQALQYMKDGESLAGRDASGIDLSELTIQSVDLRSVVLSFANLAGTRFIDCDCRGAAFANANLAGAQFVDCDLTGANFKGAQGPSTGFENCQLSKAHIQHARLNNARFNKTEWSGALLLNSDPEAQCIYFYEGQSAYPDANTIKRL